VTLKERGLVFAQAAYNNQKRLEKMNPRRALTFDDVLILPAVSAIESRSTISLDTTFLGYNLKLPIISANMDYVTEADMAVAMCDSGGFYVLHRFLSDTKFTKQVRALASFRYAYTDNKLVPIPISISIGIRDMKYELIRVADAREIADEEITVTIDVAHGHHTKVASLIQELKYQGYPRVIAGNVATAAGYQFLMDAGADAIKVGIGPGSVCTTREVTGVGVPQLTAIMDCVEAQQAWNGPPIIADGGIKNSGDIVKALAAGADMVMLGSLLAGTNEAPGEVRVDPQGNRWHPYRGQSIFGVNETKYTPEGIEGWVKNKGSVSDVLRKLSGGIRSGLSYVGANNIAELRNKANFVEVSHATHLESGTRIVEELYS